MSEELAVNTTPNLSDPAQEALRILADHPECRTPEAMSSKAIQQVEESDLHTGLRELEGLGLAHEEYGLWELTRAGRRQGA